MKNSFSWMIFNKFIYWQKKISMAISLWELQSDLSLKDAARSIEGITPSSVNYLCKKVNTCMIYYVVISMKQFPWLFLLLLQPLCLIVLFCLHFCILSHFEIIRCIVKSLIATSMKFFFKNNWKMKTWEKKFFGHQGSGTQTVYWSPKQPE